MFWREDGAAWCRIETKALKEERRGRREDGEGEADGKGHAPVAMRTQPPLKSKLTLSPRFRFVTLPGPQVRPQTQPFRNQNISPPVLAPRFSSICTAAVAFAPTTNCPFA